MAIRWTSVMIAMVALICAEAVRADVLPFFPRDKVDIVFRFQNIAEYPAFDFYLNNQFGTRTFGLTKVSPNHLARVREWGRTPGTVFLLAVPRGQEMPHQSEFDEKQPPGMLKSRPLDGENGVLGEVDNGCELTYHVHIEDGVLTVEVVELIQGRKPFILKWIVIVGFASATLAVILIWMIRRAGRATQSAKWVSRWTSV